MSIARERTDELVVLLRREHEAMADFLVALSRFDAKRLWSELGYASLFDFLHRELGLSKSAAHYRKVAAKLIRRCPAVVEPLRTGSLCFSSIIELAKVATPENVSEVLPRFLHRSKREAMQVVAELMSMASAPSPSGDTAPSQAPAEPARRRREYIPADVRRAVWERDGGRCSFSLEGGGVCGSTYQLELDHITPVALGGKSTVDDLRVACKPHNIDAARRMFGDAYVDACIERRRSAGGSGGARVAAREGAGR
jgi:HNH endonuclease